MEWYFVLKDFQSAIIGVLVGFIGFAGVIKTLKENKKLAESERIAAEQSGEQITLRAVAAELRSLEVSFAEISGLERPSAGNSIMIPQMERVITREAMKEIAALRHPATIQIIKTLLSIDEIGRAMPLFTSFSETGYFEVGPDQFDKVQKMYDSVYKEVRETLAAVAKKGLHSANA